MSTFEFGDFSVTLTIVIFQHEEQSNKVIEEEDDEEKPEFLKVGERIRSRSIHDKDAKVT